MVRFSNPLKFGNDLWDPSHRFETSWLLPPYALGGMRLVLGLYGIAVQLAQIGWYCTQPGYGGCAQAADEFSYFTVLTYWGLALYNLTAAAHTLAYARTGRPPLDRLPRPLQALHAFFHTTVCVYPFLVTAVYWGLLHRGGWFPRAFDAFTNVSQHALNSAFALAEALVPRTPAPLWVHAWWLVLVLALYLGLAFVTYRTKGFYVYGFLDVQKNGSGVTAAYVVGIAVACLVVFALVRGLVCLRLYLTERVGGMDGRFARHPERGRVDDMEMGEGEVRGDERKGGPSPISAAF